MNIYICGVPRSGKTTLAKNLKNELRDYNLIVSESIRNGFQKMDEEHYKEWGNKDSEKRRISFPKFLFEFLKWNTYFSECNNIVDLALVDIDNVIENKNKEDIIICLGYGNKEIKDIFSFIRNREKDSDYTFNRSDEELLKMWGDITRIDKYNKEICDKHNIKYFDCYENKDIVKEVVKYIYNYIKE